MIDLALAKSLAPEIARHLYAISRTSKKYSYNRGIVKRFQQSAGLKGDGLYGGGTRGALIYFAPDSLTPKPFFKPTATLPYDPPYPEPEVVPAPSLAPPVVADIPPEPAPVTVSKVAVKVPAPATVPVTPATVPVTALTKVEPAPPPEVLDLRLPDFSFDPSQAVRSGPALVLNTRYAPESWQGSGRTPIAVKYGALAVLGAGAAMVWWLQANKGRRK